jgi:hypothetical protein
VTTPDPDGTLTAADLLFGTSADAPKELTRRIMSAGNELGFGHALKRLPRVTRQAAAHEAAVAAAGLLRIDLMDILVAGWREHHDIIAAARRTLATPGSKELVGVAPHRVSTVQQPAVSVLIDGRRVHTLQLGLSIVFDVTGLVAGVHVGRLAGIHAGRCEVGVALTIHEVEALTKRAHHIELPGVKALKSGLRLLPASEYPDGDHADGLHAGGDHADGLHAGGPFAAAPFAAAHFPSVELADSGRSGSELADSGRSGSELADSGRPSVEPADAGYTRVEPANAELADSGRPLVELADSGEHMGTEISHPSSEHPTDHPATAVSSSWWERAEQERR